MASIGDRFSTNDINPVSGVFIFDGYIAGAGAAAPTAEERVIPLAKGGTFPPIRSSGKSAYWKLQRLA